MISDVCNSNIWWESGPASTLSAVEGKTALQAALSYGL
jgi:hypothetical protein